MKRILNVADVVLQPWPPQFAPKGAAAERYQARTGQIAPVLGAKKLGYNLTAVPPGKRAFPFHNHHSVEEMFYVVEGIGEVRIGGETLPIRPGDVIACPPGGKDQAHQIVNTGKAELKYLAISSKEPVDVCEYPDTGKVATQGEHIRFVGYEKDQANYWEGE
jgi:uncharacterized cupin superfamily protein